MATGTEDEETRQSTLKDLAGILYAFMGQQEAQKIRVKKEAMRQKHRFKALELMLQLLQM